MKMFCAIVQPYGNVESKFFIASRVILHYDRSLTSFHLFSFDAHSLTYRIRFSFWLDRIAQRSTDAEENDMCSCSSVGAIGK